MHYINIREKERREAWKKSVKNKDWHGCKGKEKDEERAG